MNLADLLYVKIDAAHRFDEFYHFHIDVDKDEFYYSVMQSDGNHFDGDVVSNSFDKTFWDEDNFFLPNM